MGIQIDLLRYQQAEAGQLAKVIIYRYVYVYMYIIY